MAEKTESIREQPVEKKPYSKPSVVFYGAVKTLTQSAGSANGDTGPGMMPSDRAVKQDIVRVGTHPLGIGLYLFRYRPELQARFGAGRHFGVMADEVEKIMPAAVSTASGGYKQVDYIRLGIALSRH